MISDVVARHHDMKTETAARESTGLMTPPEVADYLKVPVLTLQTWRAKRKGPRVYRVGKHVRYRRDDLDAWLERVSAP